MAQPVGLNNRTVARFAGRHLRDQVKIERLTGMVDDIPQWEVLGLFNGRLIEKSGMAFSADKAAQSYSSTVIIQTGLVFDEPSDKYRVTVSLLKTRLELDDPDQVEPEVKRTRVLMLVNVDTIRDSVGMDFIQLLRCGDGIDGS